MKKLIFLMLCCFFLSGCYEINRQNLNHLELGMNKDQVLNVMGRPDLREAYPGHEFWLYETEIETYGKPQEEYMTPVVFDANDICIGWGRNFWTSRPSKYDVKIHP